MNRYIITIIIALTLVWAVKTTPINSQNPIINIQTQSKAIDSPEMLTIPRMLNYQGKLTDATGNPVPDSTYSITFRLFTVTSGGTAFWNETQNVQTSNGLFNVLLGSLNPIDSIPQAGNCYLEMQVNPNPAMTPRVRIVSSAYAYQSRKADSANYASSAPTTRPITPPIYSAEIRDTTIIAGKIKDGAVTMSKIDQSGATAGQVIKWTGTTWAPRNDSAGGPPVGPAGGDLTGTYPNPTIANNAVNSAKIADREVTNADLAENAVTTSKITDANVTLPKISPVGSSAGQAIISTGSSTPPTWGNVAPGPHNHLGEAWTTTTIDRGLLMKLDRNTSSQINGLVDSVLNAGTGGAYGAQFYVGGTGNCARYGVWTQVSCPSGSSSGATGIYASGMSDGTGTAYGGNFYAAGGGTGTRYGVNSFVAGPGKMYGVRGSASPSSAATDSGFGVYGSCSNSGSGQTFGGFFNASGSGAGAKYGVKSNALGSLADTVFGVNVTSSNSGSAPAYGFYGKTSISSGSGWGYGGYFNVTGDGYGRRYGVYSDVTAPSSSSDPAYAYYGQVYHSGNGYVYGGSFEATGTGTADRTGVRGSAYSSSGSASVCGVDGYGTHTGPGIGYGGRFYISGGTGTRYGVYSSASGSVSSSSTIYGVYGTASHSGSGTAYGGWFRSSGSSSTNTGVYGEGTEFGVYGKGTEIGVYGWASATSNARGVYGVANGYGSSAGYFEGDNWAGTFVGHVQVGGNFYVYGSKNAVVKIDENEQRLVYCQESPEVWFEDFGEGQLKQGKADIQLDPTFLKTVTISEEHPMKVFVQLNDNCNGVYVKRGNTGFSVIELNNGTSNAHFTYRVVAKRKGYENVRLEKLEPDTDFKEIKSEDLRHHIKMKPQRNK
ncbi:MAG: hypothetical protein ABIK93_03885 [candidate division WOR-3 bacterium]